MHGAVRFLFGGFTSTAGYVPGNEARDLSISSDIALFGMIISLKRYRFYPDNPSQPSANLGKPFGFDRASTDSGFPLLLPSNGTSPYPFHLRSSKARKQFDYVRNLTLIFRCQVENTLTIALFLTWVHSVEKQISSVDKIVENGRTFVLKI
jgi:hypothetical protein